MNALSFGVNVPTSVSERHDPIAASMRAEALDYDFVSANDHPCGTAPNHETWTMLSWIAAKTERIKVATRVLGVPYRPPPMVAKMAETFARLSGGRLILGLGGGYSDEEFHAFGLGVPSAAEKVVGLEEAARIMKGLWTQTGFSFAGDRYQTADADLEPKPDLPIPIWMGTFGPRALDVTGRVADGWLPTISMVPLDAIPDMKARIRRSAEEAGRDPSDVQLIANADVHFGKDDPRNDGVIAGDAGEIRVRLEQLVELGFSAFNFCPVGPEPDHQIEKLAQDVVPSFR